MAAFGYWLQDNIVAPTRGFASDIGIQDLLKSSVSAGSNIFKAVGSLAGSFSRIGGSIADTSSLVPLIIGGVVVIGFGYYMLKSGKR